MSMKEFDKIIGYSSVRKELEQIADIMRNREAYTKLGVAMPKGLLLHGKPGVGKTLMAQCLLKASGRRYFVCRKNQPDGDFVKTIKKTFNQAVENAPSIVFLDDMDKFANGDENHRDAEEYVTVQSCIDEVKGKDVFILATANNLRNLPRSLLRTGRFDRNIEVEPPAGQDAVRIIEHYLKGKPLSADIDAKSIAKILYNCSCAELETVINEAGLYAGFERSEKITMEHFTKACMRTVFDVPAESLKKDDMDWYSNLHDYDRVSSQIVYHEAGHAVISEVLCPESVTLVSVYSRSGSSGGFTAYYHDPSERLLMKWQKIGIIGVLGGMAAIEQRFGIIDSGNSRDLAKAFDSVRHLITDNCVCGFALYSRDFEDSTELRSRQEQTVAAEVQKYYSKAKEILAQNREFFERVAAELAKKKLLHTADIQKIKAECTIVPVSI